MLAARVEDATRWEALRLLIRTTIPGIDDDGIRDVVSLVVRTGAREAQPAGR